MACPVVITGDNFVTHILGHIDCQAQYLGSYGYQSLGQPGSLASIVVSALLTLFVAFWGLRLLFGPVPGARDLVGDVIKVGIVMTLAFSWPAFRTLVYNVVLEGPAEITAAISSPGLPEHGANMTARLQAADNSMVRLTRLGTGRRTGQYIDKNAVGGTFASSALEDGPAFGWSRLAFLVGMVGSLGLIRIMAGLLLALTPLAAGLLLFEATRDLFVGWLRGLVMVMLGAAGITFVLSVELAILEPWLADALHVRELGYATPSAPIELLAMTIAFAVIQFASIWLLARVSFSRGWNLRLPHSHNTQSNAPDLMMARKEEVPLGNRAERMATWIEARVRLEDRADPARLTHGPSMALRTSEASDQLPRSERPRLGSSYRSTVRRAAIPDVGRRSSP